MKTAALVMGSGPVEKYLKGSDSAWGFDEIRLLSGEPWEIEKWKKGVAETDAEIVGFFCSTERIDGPLNDVLEKMKAENKRVVLMPHERTETTYRLRLARKPLPEHLEDFLWPTVDPSKLMGLMNFHGFVATNVFTSGGPVVDHRPPHEEGGVLLAKKLEQEGNEFFLMHEIDKAFAAYAQASVISPLPEAFYGLAACAEERGQSEEALVQLEHGLVAAETILNVLPWYTNIRFVRPVMLGLDACLRSNDLDRAERFLRIGRQADPESVAWVRYAARIKECRVRERRPIVGFSAGVPWSIVERLDKLVFDAPVVGLIDHNPAVYATAKSIPRSARFPYVLPLDQRPSLDPEELAGLHRAKGLIAVSEFQAEQYRRAYPFLPAAFIKVCPLGFVPFQPEKKNLGVVTATELNEVEKEIIERVSGTGGFDFLPGPAGFHLLTTAKIFLHIPLDEPYHCEAVLKAQAAGAVPIVAGVGCLREFVKGGYILKPPVTSDEFIDAAAKRIAHLVMHESERLAIAEIGRQRVLAENTWEAVASTWRKALA